MSPLFAKIVLIFLGFAGFFLASFIYHKKKKHEKMVCPLDANCDTVIYSRFSNFLGLPVEWMGIFYYSIIALVYGVIIVFPTIGTPGFMFGVIVVTTMAMLFSVYLVAIQAFALREWCSWCLGSALISLFIFVISLFSFPFSLVEILASYQNILFITYSFALALGVGIATLTDIYFFRSLHDHQVSKKEAGTIGFFYQLLWFVLGMFVLVGIGYYASFGSAILESAILQMVMTITLVLIINSVMVNLFVGHRLSEIPFDQPHIAGPGHSFEMMRKTVFIFGSVSIVSWYTIFILVKIGESNWSYWGLFLIYLVIVVGASVLGLYLESLFARKKISF
jgi:uncharacterized membrane protein